MLNNYRNILFLFITGFFLFGFSSFAQIDEDVDAADETALSGFYVDMDSLWALHKYERYEYIPEVSEELIADRLSCIQNEIKLTYNHQILSFIDYFVRRNRDYSRMVLRRKALYFPIFEEALKRHGMPDELKYLAIVESGLKPAAKSRSAAVGLWQFIPSTGRMYDLNVDAYIDERMDPYKATDAACKYLKWLYNATGDWQLALASYNCGPGMVRRAIRASGYKKDFWEIYNYLPQETRSYVPQFIAVTYMMNYAPEHNLFPEFTEHQIVYDTIHVNGFLDLETFSSQLNLCIQDIIKLNPEIKKNVIPENVRNYKLKLPADVIPYYLANKKPILDSSAKKVRHEELLATVREEEAKAAERALKEPVKKEAPVVYSKTKKYHKVKGGENLGSIAERYDVGLSELKKWNHLNSNNIKIGQTLVIHTKITTKVTSSTATQKETHSDSKEVSQGPKNKYYQVQPGDTLWIISKKNGGIPIEKIKKLNNLKDNNIKPGQKLIIS